MAQSRKTPGTISRTSIFVTGIVQGVGFRPFIHRLATAAGLNGHVLNTSAGVEIEVEGASDRIESFISAISSEAPPLSDITEIVAVPAEPKGLDEFVIKPSVIRAGRHQLISPDSCTCDDCQAELFDPDDRRYYYPFINCTNCGPRFTIIDALPYDRAQTTMKDFNMCPLCQNEFDDPSNRRFHAEPNACPACGPRLWLADRTGASISTPDPVTAAAAALRDGLILAIKGLGGFQLACLAGDEDAVTLLRRRKLRPHKPFAVMVESADDVSLLCRLAEDEKQALVSPRRPIVLLKAYGDSGIASSVAPGLDHYGLMLPCTPLHFLLMREVGEPLVMTSGNLSEEPICRTNTEATGRLAGIADMFLLHDREIRSTYDDSVLMIEHGREIMLRRARGYAPLPVKLPYGGEATLATGAELKNNFCLTNGDNAFISQHIGDLESAETLLHLENTESLYERLFETTPVRFACDSHPDYLSSAFCRELSNQPLNIQHHRAHIAACLAENDYTKRVIGVAMDGTGFGDDGLIWGGEFFTGGLETGLDRAAHLDYFPLLGGEAAIHEPWRTALATAWQYAPDEVDYLSDRFQLAGNRKDLLLRQLQTGLNCPLTSSSGRLFDAVAAMVLERTSVSYEAQIAMELESLARKVRSGKGKLRMIEPDIGAMSYRFLLDVRQKPWILSPARVIKRIIGDIRQGASPAVIAYNFHQGLAGGIVRCCTRLAEHHRVDTAALSGGVFQNRLLFQLVVAGLEKKGVKVLTHGQVPPNDGGISLGQAALAQYIQQLPRNE